jgi:hypothetical protein
MLRFLASQPFALLTPDCLLLLSQEQVLDKHVQCVEEHFLWISELVYMFSVHYVPSFEVPKMTRHKDI